MILSIKNEWPTLARRRVLVVDDSREITSLVADVLADDGAQVSTAHTGQDAILLLGVEKFDLLILDLVMPKPDGWKVLEFIRNAVPHMLARTVVLTAMRHGREVAKALQDWGITHLFKPFQINSLRKTVCNLLSAAERTPAAWHKEASDHEFQR
ncbi:MAG: response regulator [Phycisphaerae bacterium]|nr:response regulator [Phycisphaerae bacterium]